MQVNKVTPIINKNRNNLSVDNKNNTIPINSKTYSKSSQAVTAVNNIAFHGLFDADISDKLEAAMSHLNDNRSLVLVGNSMDGFLTYFPTLQNRYENLLLENIYFIKNDFPASFGIYKDKGKYQIFKADLEGSVTLYEGNNPKDIYSHEYVSIKEPTEIKSGYKIYLENSNNDKNQTIKLTTNPSNKQGIFDKYVQKFEYLESVDKTAFNNSVLHSLKNPKKDKEVNNDPKIYFSDIGGQDENIKKLKEEVIYPLKYPQFYEGIKQNKGILLYGPPRCGKTMLALALAKEAGVNFIKLGPQDLTRPHVGETEKNWRDIFESAKEKQPCIIFIDEFENVAVKRKGEGENSIVKDDVVSQLLILMSDLEKSGDQVYVIAATNRKDLIDSAMLNSGRFGLALEVKEPDLKGTKQIFDINKKKIKYIDENIDSKDICNLMREYNFNGANIVDVFALAHKQALKRSGVLEKMQNETISRKDEDNFKIEQNDFVAAIYELATVKEAIN